MAGKNTKTPTEPVRIARVRKPKEPREQCVCRICRKPFSISAKKLAFRAAYDGVLTQEKVYLDSGLCRACFEGRTPLPTDIAENPDIANTVHEPAKCPDCGKMVPISDYFRNHGVCVKCAEKRRKREEAKKAAAEKANAKNKAA